MLTPKENYLRTLYGGTPDWVPMYTFGKMPGSDIEPPSVMGCPIILNEHRINNGGLDHWGVNYVGNYETGGALIPEPGNFILKDIRKWRDVIKAPDLTGIDWEAMVKKDLEQSGINRVQSALALNLHVGYFQNLMAFMGFNEGLCAMYEEPDEVAALFDYLCTFYCTVAEKVVDIYKPDIWTMMDDTAAWANPFISMDMFKELLMPVYDRQAKFGRDRGLPITFHNCGKCMSFMEELHTVGITSWDPAQTCNDLDAFKAKYGNSFVIAGGWDARDSLLADDVTDEEIYESVRETIERLAPGGGFVWCGGFLGPIDDKRIAHKNMVMGKAVDEIGGSFYKK